MRGLSPERQRGIAGALFAFGMGRWLLDILDYWGRVDAAMSLKAALPTMLRSQFLPPILVLAALSWIVWSTRLPQNKGLIYDHAGSPYKGFLRKTLLRTVVGSVIAGLFVAISAVVVVAWKFPTQPESNIRQTAAVLPTEITSPPAPEQKNNSAAKVGELEGGELRPKHGKDSPWRPVTPIPELRTFREPVQPTQAHTEAGALLGINGRLGNGDKERLGNALFDFSKVLDQANRVWGEANHAGAQLNQAWNNGSLAKDIEIHRNKLREVQASAKEYEKVFSERRQKWAYYGRHIRYIFGEDPDNHALIIRNTVDEYLNQLDRWATISNKEEKPVLSLFWPVQKEFDKEMMRFSQWRQGCEHRLEEMKESIQ